MSGQILILGAAGRLGHAAAEAFCDAGWTVASLVRPGAAARAAAATQVIEIDALDHAAVRDAARGVDVVLHALNPQYTEWSRLALPLAYSAINAAETAGATLLCRELSEIAYLWHEQHRIDGGKLAATIGEVPHTPLDLAIARALQDLGAAA